MAYLNEVTKKPWPRWAVHPEYGRAIFHCAGDVPPSYKLEIPLEAPASARDETTAELMRQLSELREQIAKRGKAA